MTTTKLSNNTQWLIIDSVSCLGMLMYQPVIVTIDSIGMVVGEIKLKTKFFSEAGARTWAREKIRDGSTPKLSTYSNPQAG